MVFLGSLVDLPLWFLLLCLLAILVYLYGTYPYRVWNELGVRGPAPVPFIGNIDKLFDDRVGTRASIKQWQNQYGRMIGTYFFRKPVLIVTDPDALRQIFVKSFNNFTDRFMVGEGYLQQRIIKKGIFFSDGADWRRMRKIMSPTFSSGKIKLLVHYINLTAERLGENLRKCADDKKPGEAKKLFGAFTLDVICGTAFGLDTNSQQDMEGQFIQQAKGLMTFKKSVQLVMGCAGVFPFLGPLMKMLKLGFFKASYVDFFEEKISALIKERKASGEQQINVDFLQLLMNAEADPSDDVVGDKKLTTEEITAQGIIFIIAGYETTSTTLQYLAYELGKNPDVQAKVVAEMKEVLTEGEKVSYENCQNLKYMEAMINETLRMYPPVHLLTRRTEQDIVLNDVSLPANSAILIPLSSIGRDPEFFPDPDKFRPERFLENDKHSIDPMTFAPFGHGPRQCIGLRLAILELKVALVHMLSNVRIVGVAPEVLDLEDYTGVLVPRVPITLELQTVS